MAPEIKDRRNLGTARESGKSLDGVSKKEERECHDVFFLVLFIVFWIGMLIVAIMSFRLGQPVRLTYGMDSWGNVCGARNNRQYPNATSPNNSLDMRGKDYLFFGNPFNPNEFEICVEACPTENPPASVLVPPVSLGFTNVSFTNYSEYTVYCAPDFDNRTGGQVAYDNIAFPSPLSEGFYDPATPCYFAYATTDVLRRCVPAPSGNVYNATVDKAMDAVQAQKFGQAILADINEAKYYILGCAGIALALSFVWLIFLRFFAGAMVYITIFVFLIVCVVITIFFFVQAKDARETYNAAQAEGIATDRQKFNFQTLTVFAIACIVFTVGVFAVLCFMWRNIAITIVIIEEAAEALRNMPFIVFFPVVLFVFVGGFLAYWIAVWLFLGTAGTPLFDEQGRVLSFAVDKSLRAMQFYHIFGGLWTLQWFLGFGEMVIAGAIASWYFAADKKKDIPENPTLASVQRAFRFHLGSICFGSLIIAVVQAIRLMIKYLKKSIQAQIGKDNCFSKFMEYVFCCLDCCFWCLEKFLAFITRNAYIHIAIYGDSFCKAAKDITQLLWRNALLLTTVNVIGDFMLFLGKVIVTFIVGIISILMLRDNENLNYYAFPVLIILIFSYGISSLFMEVFEMAIDTIFVCVCEDLERADKNSPPKYMSDDLKALLAHTSEKSKPKFDGANETAAPAGEAPPANKE